MWPRSSDRGNQHSVVVHYLNIVRIAIMPEKAEPPTIVDPYAVLALTVTLQSFQSIAPNCAKIRKTGRSVKPPKPLACLVFDGSKPPASITFVKRSGLFATEGANHLRKSYHVRRSMSDVHAPSGAAQTVSTAGPQ